MYTKNRKEVYLVASDFFNLLSPVSFNSNGIQIHTLTIKINIEDLNTDFKFATYDKNNTLVEVTVEDLHNQCRHCGEWLNIEDLTYGRKSGSILCSDCRKLSRYNEERFSNLSTILSKLYKVGR